MGINILPFAFLWLISLLSLHPFPLPLIQCDSSPSPTPSLLSPPSFPSPCDGTSPHSSLPRILFPHRYPSSNLSLPSPPRHLPPFLSDFYTRCNSIPTADYFVDDTNGGLPTHYIYSHNDILNHIKSAKQIKQNVKKYLKSTVVNENPRRPPPLSRVPEIYFILQKYKHFVKGKSCLVIGSMDPTYESMLISYGASHVTTSEYNKLTFTHEKITTMTPMELEEKILHKKVEKFDLILVIDTLDHDGLGRYGDPISPDGDLLSMDNIRNKMIKSDGVLILSLPVGGDLVVWNLMRRYGKIRLPLMLAGWEIIYQWGLNPNVLEDHKADYRQRVEPIWILKSKNENNDSDEDKENVNVSDRENDQQIGDENREEKDL